jgi:hypothetical protein
MRTLIAEMIAQWHELDRRISAFDAELVSWLERTRNARRITSIPGCRRHHRYRCNRGGRQGRLFSGGRDLAAWLGLVPRQSTTGGRPCLLGISKRGNKYLRRLFIHGVRCTARCGRARYTVGPLGKGIAGPRSSERCGGGGRQQARADRAATRTAIRSPAGAADGIAVFGAPGGLRVGKARGLTVDRCAGTLIKKMAR